MKKKGVTANYNSPLRAHQKEQTREMILAAVGTILSTGSTDTVTFAEVARVAGEAGQADHGHTGIARPVVVGVERQPVAGLRRQRLGQLGLPRCRSVVMASRPVPSASR